MTPEEFQSCWRELPVPTSSAQLEASQVSARSGIWVARDISNRQHLLVQIPDGVTLDIAGTHGLGVSIARHRIPGHADASYIDLVCLDQAVAATFAAVAADIAEEAVQADAGERRSQVIAVLNEWRWFWGVDPAQLSSADAVGLFGELWFLIRWVGASAQSVQAWNASHGARHDFQWPERSVEVKATSRGGGVVHTIQNLEQLADAETGGLYLYSLRVARDALAANTLNSLVDIASAALGRQPEARADLLAKLGQRGYSPAGRDQSAVPYRVVEEGLYRVADEFPRLTRASFPSGLPNGIASVSYQLDVSACAGWRVGADPTAWPPP
ncbi:MAG TPA: PD-(D/E)XK motif protein [Streptosporangiaceae bacterium]|nr:PD-(D/E)XK motif protein [Streptosporangiaceae bacterium]